MWGKTNNNRQTIEPGKKEEKGQDNGKKNKKIRKQEAGNRQWDGPIQREKEIKKREGERGVGVAECIHLRGGLHPELILTRQ